MQNVCVNFIKLFRTFHIAARQVIFPFIAKTGAARDNFTENSREFKGKLSKTHKNYHKGDQYAMKNLNCSNLHMIKLINFYFTAMDKIM